MDKLGGFKIPIDIINDIITRFILNIPQEYSHDMIRVFFQIEQAHWFYIDCYMTEYPHLKGIKIKDFAYQIFKHCPLLKNNIGDLDELLQKWKMYKHSVPTYGAILLDPSLTKVLLVQGFSNTWGFPKGKVNEKEEPDDCAVREVKEEVGYDISNQISVSEHVNHTVQEQECQLYIIPDVPLDTKFQPRTKNEIKDFAWVPVEQLPTNQKRRAGQEQQENPKRFFLVAPFVPALKKWIIKFKRIRQASAALPEPPTQWGSSTDRDWAPMGSPLTKGPLEATPTSQSTSFTAASLQYSDFQPIGDASGSEQPSSDRPSSSKSSPVAGKAASSSPMRAPIGSSAWLQSKQQQQMYFDTEADETLKFMEKLKEESKARVTQGRGGRRQHRGSGRVVTTAPQSVLSTMDNARNSAAKDPNSFLCPVKIHLAKAWVNFKFNYDEINKCFPDL